MPSDNVYRGMLHTMHMGRHTTMTAMLGVHIQWCEALVKATEGHAVKASARHQKRRQSLQRAQAGPMHWAGMGNHRSFGTGARAWLAIAAGCYAQVKPETFVILQTNCEIK